MVQKREQLQAAVVHGVEPELESKLMLSLTL